MDKFKYFTGKICTVYTHVTNKQFDDQQHANSFTGLVEEIDEFGIWLRLLPKMEKKAFFPAPVIGIVEEEVIPITTEQETAIKEAYLKEQSPASDLITLGGIKNLAEKTKTKYQEK
jgi:hypothetical protein